MLFFEEQEMISKAVMAIRIIFFMRFYLFEPPHTMQL